MKYFFTILISSITAFAHANSCEDFYESPIVRKTLQAINESSVVWASFDPKNFDIVLTDAHAHSRCLLLVSSGKLTKMSLKESILIQNGAYSSIPSWGEKSETELLLKSKGVE
jgi:hypothetical protein